MDQKFIQSLSIFLRLLLPGLEWLANMYMGR